MTDVTDQSGSKLTDVRVHYECTVCCYGVSGNRDSYTVEDKLDKHEAENPGHRMKEAEDY